MIKSSFIREDHSRRPLMVPKILQKILEYIPSNQYKELRKVSRIWNVETCKLSQSREIVTLGTCSNCEKYIRQFSKSPEVPLDFPYPHSSFQFPRIRMNLISNLYVLRKFFSVFGPQIKHLSLSLSKTKFKMKFLRLLIFQYVTNLERLTINFFNFESIVARDLYDDQEILPLLNCTQLTIYGYGNTDHLTSVLTQILRGLPNLRKLEAGEVLGRLLFDIIYGPPKLVPKLEITDLELSSLSPKQIDRIIENQLCLTSLKTEVGRCVTNFDIRNLLNQSAPDLVDLVLEFPPESSRPPDMLLAFPNHSNPMLKLVRMEITRCKMDISMISRINFPVLRRLRLNLVDLVYDYENQDIYFPNDALQCLTLHICRGLTPDLVKGCGKTFPKLRKLDIRTEPHKNQEDLLAAICEDLKTLDELRINHEVLKRGPLNEVIVFNDMIDAEQIDLLISSSFGWRKLALSWKFRSKSI